MKNFVLICLLLVFSNCLAEEIIWKKGVSHLGFCNKVIISPVNNAIANSLNSFIHLRDMDGNILTTFEGHEEFVTDLIFSPDGLFLFSSDGNYDNPEYLASIIKWDITSYSLDNAYQPDEPENYFFVQCIDISDNGQMIAGLFTARTKTAGIYDMAIFVWNVETAEILAKFEFKGGSNINKIKFLSDKIYFNLGGRLAMIQTNNFTLVEKVGENETWHNIPISDFDISTDGQNIITIDLEGNSKIFNLTNDTITTSFVPIFEGTNLIQVLFGKDNDYLLYLDKLINNMTVYSLVNMEQYHRFTRHTAELNSMSINDQKDKALLSDGDNLYLINIVYDKTIDVQESQNDEINIYPNPVNLILNLQLDRSCQNSCEYTINDYLGREVQKGNISNFESALKVDALPIGYYSLFVKNGTKMIKRNFIKL